MLTEFARWRSENRILNATVWFIAVLLLASTVGVAFDHRHILGLNPWIKPIKFDLSTIIFLATVAAILSALETSPRARRVIAVGTGIAMAVEDAIISLQSLRGVRSHMNFDTATDASLFAVMGIFIAFNTMLLVWLLLLSVKVRMRWPRAVVWGIRLGLFAIVAGSLEGVFIVLHGAHTVGAPDGLAGLPFLNWSTEYGDLRVPHFFALHALQVMPLAGLLLDRTGWPRRVQLPALLSFFTAYMGVVWLLFHQALSGRPFLR